MKYERHRNTALIKIKCPVRGSFHYAEITPQCENYESQFNYYFNILWGSAAVTDWFRIHVRNFMIFLNDEKDRMELFFKIEENSYTIFFIQRRHFFMVHQHFRVTDNEFNSDTYLVKLYSVSEEEVVKYTEEEVVKYFKKKENADT